MDDAEVLSEVLCGACVGFFQFTHDAVVVSVVEGDVWLEDVLLSCGGEGDGGDKVAQADFVAHIGFDGVDSVSSECGVGSESHECFLVGGGDGEVACSFEGAGSAFYEVDGRSEGVDVYEVEEAGVFVEEDVGVFFEDEGFVFQVVEFDVSVNPVDGFVATVYEPECMDFGGFVGESDAAYAGSGECVADGELVFGEC